MPDEHASSEEHDHDELLRAAGFGCVICGCPIVELAHDLAGMPNGEPPVLCPHHLSRLRSGDIEASVLAAAIAAPTNVAAGTTDGLLTVGTPFPVIRMSGVVIVNDGLLVVADREAFLGLKSAGARLLLSLRLLDEDGQELIVIEDNLWLSGDAGAWTVESGPRSLSIRDAKGAVVIELGLQSAPIRFSARLMQNGVPIELRGSGLRVGGTPISLTDDGAAGCYIDIDTERRTAQLKADPAHGGHAMILSEPDPVQRIVKGLNAMGGLREHVQSAEHAAHAH